MQLLRRFTAFLLTVMAICYCSTVQAAGTADAVITGIADDGEATWTAVKAIGVVIFGALVGIGILGR